jgi:hypothetical protein
VDQGRRTRIALLCALLLAAGCDDEPADAAPEPTRPPAAAAGGVCRLLDYAVIKDAVGITFEVAASAQQGQTETCVVQPSGESYPDLLLTLTNTTIDASVFTKAVTPKGASAVPGLGKVAYSTPVPVTGDAGPGFEVAWLSAKYNSLMMLRLRVPPEAPAVADAAAPKLVALAKVLEAA